MVFYNARFQWTEHSEETQTLRTGCSKAEPKISPRCRPPSRGTGGQNLISYRWSLPLPTNPVWWGSMHAISSYCGSRPTNTHTHIQTDRTDYNTLCRSFASTQCNKFFKSSVNTCTETKPEGSWTKDCKIDSPDQDSSFNYITAVVLLTHLFVFC